MLNILQAIVLGAVEGLTEFLPISSTGHLILVTTLLHLQETDFIKSFTIIIQLGAILAVVALYWRSLFLNIEVFKRVAAAFIPTGVLGLLFYKLIKTYLLGNTAIVLWSLLLGGVTLIVFEKLHHEPATDNESLTTISYKNAVIIGVFQAIAMIPGVSRAAATIVGGLLLGYKRKTVVEFSFLLAIPTMLAATGLDLIKNANSFSRDSFSLIFVGFVTAFIVAWFSIKWLLGFIKNHNFTGFGIYRIAVALLFIFVR